MIFNDKRKHKVSYTQSPNSIIPKFLLPEITKRKTIDFGCPAIKSTHNKLYNVLSPYTVEITFGLDNNAKPFAYWNFNNKDMQVTDEISDMFNHIINVQLHNGKAVLQLHTYLVFVTDDAKDIEVTMLPPDEKTYNNCVFVPGSFYINNWIREINPTYMQTTDESATVTLTLGEPFANLMFNYKVDLNYIDGTDNINKYYKYSHNIVSYYKNVRPIINNIINKRPNKLL